MCWKHIPEGMIKCCCGYVVGPTQQIINEIKDRFETLCRPQWKVVLQRKPERLAIIYFCLFVVIPRFIHLTVSKIQHLQHIFLIKFRVQIVETTVNATKSVQTTPHRTHVFSVHMRMRACGSSFYGYTETCVLVLCAESSSSFVVAMSLLNIDEHTLTTFFVPTFSTFSDISLSADRNPNFNHCAFARRRVWPYG